MGQIKNIKLHIVTDIKVIITTTTTTIIHSLIHSKATSHDVRSCSTSFLHHRPSPPANKMAEPQAEAHSLRAAQLRRCGGGGEDHAEGALRRVAVGHQCGRLVLPPVHHVHASSPRQEEEGRGRNLISDNNRELVRFNLPMSL